VEAQEKQNLWPLASKHPSMITTMQVYTLGIYAYGNNYS